ncbi:hypothetical protein LDENG_00261360 [Lucifuga dentata]|nr:hypothetical protein LDENG_00261360 [Lucifuga dentata]
MKNLFQKQFKMGENLVVGEEFGIYHWMHIDLGKKEFQLVDGSIFSRLVHQVWLHEINSFRRYTTCTISHANNFVGQLQQNSKEYQKI